MALALLCLVTAQFASLTLAEDLGYRFQETSRGECLNSRGYPGHNPGWVGQCGDWYRAELRGAEFRSVDLAGSRFFGADLTGAKFEGRLKAVSFLGANLTDAVMDNTFSCKYPSSLNSAKIDRTRFHRSFFCDTPFRYARGEDVYFKSSYFASVDFYGALLPGAIFANSKLTGVVFDFADLKGATFHSASITNSSMRNADLRGADLEHTKLLRVDLQGAVYNDSTRLPFARDRADKYGMRYRP